ncbi:MAG: hydrogenase iron-sulfur subunit [Deltaproteobacteria bacterium]|nr:hydrogenase iron-sulfur subunit [Deltaproteobacteria bacterium]
MERRTLIIGSGSSARNIAEDLLNNDIEIIVAVKDEGPGFSLSNHIQDASAEVLKRTRLVKCRGSVGNFTVFMDQKGKTVERNVSNIIIAEEDRREPNFALYGLTSSDCVLSVSRVMDLLNAPQQADIRLKRGPIVILTGILGESNPVIAEEIMLLSLRLQLEFQKQVYILTRNLKVAGDGLEALYRKTKDAGVVYIKFSDASPSIEQKEDGNVFVEFYDEITRHQFRLTPDITVVDETIVSSVYVSELAEILKIERDNAGFAQADNVHRISVFTNRRGIIAVGPARTVQTAAGHDIDASNAALSAFELLENKLPGPENKAEINPGRCVRCLTCYRLCPYSAIQLDTKPVVAPDACEGCGICASECPRSTINIKGLSSSDIADELTKPGFDNRGKTFIPFIVAFCCRRSAARAGEIASGYGHDLPLGLKIIELPCAGSISHDHIFTAFMKGADGVMVLTCHEGNCHSEKGNIFARQRVDMVFEFLTQMGFEKERLIIKSLAANMAMEFSEFTSGFEKQIIDLGASRIKPGGQKN